MMLNAHGLDGPSESKFCYYKRTLMLTKLDLGTNCYIVYACGFPEFSLKECFTLQDTHFVEWLLCS